MIDKTLKEIISKCSRKKSLYDSLPLRYTIMVRVATDKIKWEGLIPPLSPSDETIITFYSDRNLGQRMEFKNPNVAKYYASRESTNNDNKSDDTRECKDFMQKEIQKRLIIPH